MDRDRAIALVGYLVASTTGWNDDSVLVYAREIEKLSNAEVAATAIQRLATSWTEARRPPVAEVLNVYRRELARVQSAPAQIGPGKAIPPGRGIEIAREAYEAERRRLGKPVNMKRFDRMIAAMFPTA